MTANEVQATCWFQDGECPHCGEPKLATDGQRTWCCSKLCFGKIVKEKEREELEAARGV